MYCWCCVDVVWWDVIGLCNPTYRFGISGVLAWWNKWCTAAFMFLVGCFFAMYRNTTILLVHMRVSFGLVLNYPVFRCGFSYPSQIDTISCLLHLSDCCLPGIILRVLFLPLGFARMFFLLIVPRLIENKNGSCLSYHIGWLLLSYVWFTDLVI